MGGFILKDCFSGRSFPAVLEEIYRESNGDMALGNGGGPERAGGCCWWRPERAWPSPGAHGSFSRIVEASFEI